MPAINTGPKDPIAEITDLLAPLINVVHAVTDALSGLVKSVVKGAADFAGDALSSVFSSLTKVAGIIGETLMAVLGPVGAIIIVAVAAVAAAFVAAVAAIGLVVGLFTELIEVGSSFVKVLAPQTAQELDRAMAELNATIGQAFLPMIIEATRYIRELADAIAPSMSDIGAKIKELFMLIEPVITDLAMAFLDFLPLIITLVELFVALTAAIIPLLKLLSKLAPENIANELNPKTWADRVRGWLGLNAEAPIDEETKRSMPGNIGSLGTATSVGNIIEGTAVGWQDNLVSGQTETNHLLETINTGIADLVRVLNPAGAPAAAPIESVGAGIRRGMQFAADETSAGINSIRRFFGGW